jgi:hypothetical protein
VTVLEILKPAGQTAVESGEDRGQRVPVADGACDCELQWPEPALSNFKGDERL